MPNTTPETSSKITNPQDPKIEQVFQQSTNPPFNPNKRLMMYLTAAVLVIVLFILALYSFKTYKDSQNSNSSNSSNSSMSSSYTTYSYSSMSTYSSASSMSSMSIQSDSSMSTPNVVGDNTPDTTSGIKLAKWGTNVTLSFANDKVEFKSDGLPNHSRAKEYAVPNGQGNAMIPTAATAKVATDPSKAQNYDFKIPTKPSKATTVTNAPLGTIGVMISGAALFNPYEGDGKTVALSSNFTIKNSSGEDVAFLDTCNGHPQGQGAYHYHGLPTCITSVVDKTGEQSHMLGLAFDGYPIYGDKGIGGNQLTSDMLDECNGITSATPEFPDGIYHYVLLNVPNSRSSIKCFSGNVDSSLLKTLGMMM